MKKHDREVSDDRSDKRGRVDTDTSAAQQRPPLTEMKRREITSADEAADPSVQNPDNPLLVREDVKNTSDSSGLKADDEAKGEQIKEQLKRGATDVRPMD